MSRQHPVLDALGLLAMVDLMHGRRRGSRRRRNHPARVILAAIAVLIIAGVVRHDLGWLILTAAIGGVCFWLGRRSRPVLRARLGDSAPTRTQEVAPDVDRLRQQAREADARSEQYAGELSRVRGQVADLEDVANRDIEEITASYKHMQKIYGRNA